MDSFSSEGALRIPAISEIGRGKWSFGKLVQTSPQLVDATKRKTDGGEVSNLD